jgi:CheY-like chemotaxis protein/HPt (histidine-containing phosphotransfer) domain-containing protein
MNESLKILLVEDLEMNRTFFIKFLARKGLSCDVAVNGEEAADACGKKNYDIIFMDCQMPVMDGYEATRRIRASEGENRHTVIIAMTACAMDDDKNRCLEAGMDDYLSKPFKFEELVVMLEKYARSLNEIDSNPAETDYFSETLALLMKETGFDEETCVELLHDFCGHARNLLYEIQENINNYKLENACVLLHQLKGSSGSIRVKKMSELAFEAEAALGASDIEKLKNILEGLNKTLDALIKKEKNKLMA